MEYFETFLKFFFGYWMPLLLILPSILGGAFLIILFAPLGRRPPDWIEPVIVFLMPFSLWLLGGIISCLVDFGILSYPRTVKGDFLIYGIAMVFLGLISSGVGYLVYSWLAKKVYVPVRLRRRRA